MSEITPIKPISFACPKCKRPLHSGENALQCSECNQTYLIEGGDTGCSSDKMETMTENDESSY